MRRGYFLLPHLRPLILGMPYPTLLVGILTSGRLSVRAWISLGLVARSIAMEKTGFF